MCATDGNIGTVSVYEVTYERINTHNPQREDL